MHRPVSGHLLIIYYPAIHSSRVSSLALSNFPCQLVESTCPEPFLGLTVTSSINHFPSTMSSNISAKARKEVNEAIIDAGSNTVSMVVAAGQSSRERRGLNKQKLKEDEAQEMAQKGKDVAVRGSRISRACCYMLTVSITEGQCSLQLGLGYLTSGVACN